MAFKLKGFNPGDGTGLKNKFRIKRAKRLVRKNVGNTTVDSPTFDENKFVKSEKKMKKADKLMKKAGYSFEDREQAGGAAGYSTAMNWASKKKKNK